MCKLLICRRVQQPTGDEAVDAGMFQRGHVITIIEDSQEFGDGDVGSHAIAVSVPNVKKADLEFLLAEEIEETVSLGLMQRIVKTKMLQVRMYCAKDVNEMLGASGRVTIKKGKELAFAATFFDKVEKLAVVKAKE